MVDDVLLAGTGDGNGGTIWSTEDGDTWTLLMSGGFGDTGNTYTTPYAAADGRIFVGTHNSESGAEVWVSGDFGQTWIQSNIDGFGDVQNNKIGALHVRPTGVVYASTSNNQSGANVWRLSRPDGDWELVTNDAFGTLGSAIESFIEYDETLWLTVAIDSREGAQVWRLDADSGEWRRVIKRGFSDPANEGIMSVLPSNGTLLFGTFNLNGGCEVWRMRPLKVDR